MARVKLSRRKVHFSFTDLKCERAVLHSRLGPSLEEQIDSYIPM